MTRALWLLLTLVLLAALVWLRWPTSEAPPPAGGPVVSEPVSVPPAEPTTPVPTAGDETPLAAEPEVADAPDPVEPGPGEARLPLVAKLAAEKLSDVPHELVGAWDDRRDAPELGKHRVLVAVVSPDAEDVEIERLLRDARARHRDAEILDVRVYDSAGAARRAGWVGERQLVGEIKRNDRLGYDAMMVRGHPIAH